jgi:hypothetical protein
MLAVDDSRLDRREQEGEEEPGDGREGDPETALTIGLRHDGVGERSHDRAARERLEAGEGRGREDGGENLRAPIR